MPFMNKFLTRADGKKEKLLRKFFSNAVKNLKISEYRKGNRLVIISLIQYSR